MLLVRCWSETKETAFARTGARNDLKQVTGHILVNVFSTDLLPMSARCVLWNRENNPTATYLLM